VDQVFKNFDPRNQQIDQIKIVEILKMVGQKLVDLKEQIRKVLGSKGN
jgi:hypothetical protein